MSKYSELRYGIDFIELDGFMKNKPSNSWITVGEYSIYLRKGHHCIAGNVEKTLDLANIKSNANQYAGFWTIYKRLCSTALSYDIRFLYLECVDNTRLLEAYLKRDCIRNGIDSTNLYKKLT